MGWPGRPSTYVKDSAPHLKLWSAWLHFCRGAIDPAGHDAHEGNPMTDGEKPCIHCRGVGTLSAKSRQITTRVSLEERLILMFL